MDTVYTRLRQWRWQQALALEVPVFFVLSNAHLAAIALRQPSTFEELAQCPGVGPKKLAMFGEALLDMLQQCAAEGLEAGVVPPPEPAERPLTDEEVAEIAAQLRQELADRVARRLKGKFTATQVAEALRRMAGIA